MLTAPRLAALSHGLGLRQPHYRDLIESLPALDFVEVHSENFFGAGGAALRVLEGVRAHYPVSLHGVGLSLGSADELARAHLEKLARLIERIEPTLVSEHLCWGSIDGVHYNDLLPMPYTKEALELMTTRIERVQDYLGRQILVENISAYLCYRDCEFTETQFLAELARRSGCAILLDLNNLYVNGLNFGTDPLSLVDQLPAKAVGEIHLAGHQRTDDCAIDDHGSPVSPAVWQLYGQAQAALGPKPTLIEWDTNIPGFEVLLGEVAQARECTRRLELAHA